jgi:2-oxoglutarate ferredoxin oxidoreductase subunit beta
MLLLNHEDGVTVSPELSRIYHNQERHDPADRNRAREIASIKDPIPVGVLFRRPEIPCYEDIHAPDQRHTTEGVMGFLENEFDKFSINPSGNRAT